MQDPMHLPLRLPLRLSSRLSSRLRPPHSRRPGTPHAPSRWRPRAACAGLALLAGLSGCTLGPDFERPEVTAPVHYAAGGDPEATETTAAGRETLPSDPAAARTSDPWWQGFGSEELNALVVEGLEKNRDLNATVASLAAARARLAAQVGSSLLPTLGADAQTSHQRALGLPSFGPETSIYKVYAGVLDINYDIDLFGGIRRNNEAASAAVQSAAFELEAARDTLAANIVATAIQSAALCAEVQADTRLVALAKETEALTQKRYELGAAPHKDVLDAMRLARSAAAALPALRAQHAGLRHTLAVLLGRHPEDAPADLDLDLLTLPAAIPVTVPSELVHRRPDVLAAEASLHAATARLGVATANLFPQLNLSGSFGSEAFHRGDFFAGPGRVWSVAAGATQPIFAGGALLSERRATEHDLDAAMNRYQATVLRAFQNVADALKGVEAAAQIENERARAVSAAEHFYGETVRRHAAGSETRLAVVASEESWQQERVNHIQSQSQQWIEAVQLYQALGAGTGPSGASGALSP